MRDLFVTAVIFGALPFALKYPHIGIYLWSWISYMNPHRLAWGFAYNFPFAAFVAVAVFISLVFSREKITYFWSPILSWLVLLNIWFLITTFFSLQPDDSWVQWEKVFKIQLFTFLTVWIINDRRKLHFLVWVIALSVGFYGIKGGIFTLTGGGSSHVLGPSGGFISGNTEIGLAMVMILPLIWYLYLNTIHLWARRGLVVAMLLIPVAILGTQSRGALLAIGAIAFFLWIKSRKKLVPLIVIIIMAPLLFNFMPQSWHDRMSTITSSEEERDTSAQGRLLAWEFATKMAVARPLGGGFRSFTPENYERYAPGLIAPGEKYQDSHSIYFGVLGEHGFVGLGIFLVLGFLGWRSANKIIKLTRKSKSDKWAYDLASMLQVSLVGYATGGAFLGLAYFDLPYHILIMIVIILRLIEQQSQPQPKLNS
ncbi:putative O-glycosylation ligase, exosortase A system-associated [Nitrosomonas sp. HPC101]|uniref:putative O-glycosylation ligase, exosortase A system-associated n=1 Tax=Nitrosomonas sp. HPC101 TaxID=1658667 RepID=UPI00136E3C6A|nr:putative O-glycosylation ligase, exosortase A system-associated [Nitrosomonas sp. HPC101]MXS85790.1 putative O-glycosylation ligase, exosortase A system-associated [Nitrosomonas sp. HPC101]